MQFQLIIAILFFITSVSSPACAAGGEAAKEANVGAHASGAGSSLGERMEAAIQKERAASKGSRFWTVHKFKLRKGIGLDAELPRDLRGNTFVQGLSIARRTAAESRNAGVYLLHDLSDGSIEKVELHDLDRYREEGGLPFRMLGEAETSESLELLKRLYEKRPGGLVGERLVLAMALHDDPRAEAILKGVIAGSYDEKERAQAAQWLGDLPGQSAYLEGLARDERMPPEVRKQAVVGIGYSQSPAVLSVLRNLYATTSDREVKEQCLFAASMSEDKKGAAAFLNEVKASDPDPDFRRQAEVWLKQLADRGI